MTVGLPLVLDRTHSRMVDRIAIDEYGMSGLVLMENAGRGCAERLIEVGIDGEVVVCCGAGNNGGDGLVVARHLRNAGFAVRVLMCADPDSLAKDARRNFDILAKTENPPTQLDQANAEEVERQLAPRAGQKFSWIVDALLGTGAVGELRGPPLFWIPLINASKARRMAVDIPSGLDCESGIPQGDCVESDETCTFATLKPCFLREPGRRLSGRVNVIDIGIPREILFAVEKCQTRRQAIDFADEQSKNGLK